MFITLNNVAMKVSNVLEIKPLKRENDDSRNGKYKTNIVVEKGEGWVTPSDPHLFHEALRCAKDPEYAHRMEIEYLMDRIRKAEKAVDAVLDSRTVQRMSDWGIGQLREASQILNSKHTKAEDETGVGYIN